MKFFFKILTIFFLIIFILQLGLLLFLTLAPNASQAANEINFKPQVIQNLGYNFDSNDKTTGNIANLVRAIYKYAIGIVGILAAVVLMIGGLLWIVAGGSSAQIGEAKAWIGASLTGLLLALLSYLILATINPALVNLKTTGIQYVEKTPVTQSTLLAGQTCTPGKAPYCDYGLECQNGTCVKTAESQALSSSGQYQWKQVSECSLLNKINYNDNNCSSPRPGKDYLCCGIFLESDNTEVINVPVINNPPTINLILGCCKIIYYTGGLWSIGGTGYCNTYQNTKQDDCKTGLYNIPSGAYNVSFSFDSQSNGSCANATASDPSITCATKN